MLANRKVRAFFLHALPALCAILILSGCVTARPYIPGNPLAVLGSGASYYVVLPVEANRALLDQYARTQKHPEDFVRLFDRTGVVFAGVFPGNEDRSSVRFLASGSFPGTLAPLLFSSSKGWKKTHSGNGSWYHSEAFDVALPRNGLVCGSSGDGIETLLDNLKKNDSAVLPVSPAFRDYAQTALADGRIGLYTGNPAPLLERLLGPEVTLPVTYAELYAKSSGSEGYVLSAHIALADSRSARAMQVLLRLAFQEAEMRQDGVNLYMTGYVISNEKLVTLLGFLYFNSK